jgi:rare lipoprotein A
MATLRTGEPAPSPSTVRVASAHAFVPEIPMSTRPMRGDVPIPEGRPYSLGNTPGDVASINATSEISASRKGARVRENPRSVSYDGAGNDTSAAGRPVSAYAPPERDGINDLLSGRGLY